MFVNSFRKYIILLLKITSIFLLGSDPAALSPRRPHRPTTNRSITAMPSHSSGSSGKVSLLPNRGLVSQILARPSCWKFKAQDDGRCWGSDRAEGRSHPK